MKILTVLVTLILATGAVAGAISNKTAKKIYLVSLRNAEAMNSGDGVLEKSGNIQCFEVGARAPFRYTCGSLSPKTSKEIYLQGLAQFPAINGGDSVLEKSATVTCFEKGLRPPYSYFCSFN